MSRRGALSLVLGVAVVSAVLFASTESGGERSSGDRRPNIVFVLSDDQPDNTFGPRTMPRTFAALGEAVDLTDAIAAPPLCCPYRAGVVSGQVLTRPCQPSPNARASRGMKCDSGGTTIY